MELLGDLKTLLGTSTSPEGLITAHTDTQKTQLSSEKTHVKDGDIAIEIREPEAEASIRGEHPFRQALKLDGNAEKIRKVAEWAGFEKNAVWHTRVGYIVTDTRLTDVTEDSEETLAEF